MSDTPLLDEFIPSEQPEEIEDEYRLSLEDGVVDEALLEPSEPVNFSITSYGADYTVDTLLRRMELEAFYVPKFQRSFVWSQRHASRFIESLLLGLPVPGIFLYKEASTGRHLVVDGQQRLISLKSFYEGTFGDRKFRLVGVKEDWANKSYKELDLIDQRRIDDSIIHATIFQQDEPKDSLKSLYFVFERINSGGIRLSPQEIRNCINDGPLLDAIRQLNSNDKWRSVFGRSHASRLKDQEMILRFFAMLFDGENYKAPMRDFLNAFCGERVLSSADIAQISSLFVSSISVCSEALGDSAFRPSRALNAAVYEAVMVGVATRISETAPLHPNDLKVAYDKLLANKEFLRACEYATAREENVKRRRELSIEFFRTA